MALLLLGLSLLPLWALWGASEEAPLDFRPALWVAWSGRGGTPALAVTGFSPEAPREAWILLPGEGGAGASLWEGLARSGVETASEFLVPPGAAFARSAERLGENLAIRRLTLCEAPRGKTPGDSLAQALAREGGALQRCAPRREEDGGYLWEGTLGEGGFSLRRPAPGEWQGLWQGREGEPRLDFRYPATGVLEVTWNGRRILQLPQTTPGGWRRLPLP
ncbi:MAG: hypothetical protein ACI4SG_06700 [Oligosphaeraceae bacterium]